MSKWTGCLVLTLLFCPAMEFAHGQREGQRVVLDSSVSGDELGTAVAIDGDVIVSGAPLDGELGNQAGAAHVFRFSEDESVYEEEQRLLASDGAVGAGFGISVAVSGDVIVVGAYEDAAGGTNAGAVYVYRHDGIEWAEEQKLVADDAAGGDRYGFSVSVSGDVIAVGSRGDDDEGSSSGSAYVYRYHPDDEEWTEEDKVTASDGAASDLFGWSVSLSDDVLLVGAKWDDDNGSMSGSAYVFRNSGSSWTEESKLTASDGEFDHNFGVSVSVRVGTAVVGAYDCCFTSGTGFAYVFTYDSDSEEWSELQKLTASDAGGNDLFGGSVAVTDGVIVVGASEEDGSGSEAGAAYLFRFVEAKGEWSEYAKVFAPDASADDQFGSSVSVSGTVACVGSPFNDDDGTDGGAVYVYDTILDCNGNGIDDDRDVADGDSEDCNENGIPDECDRDEFRAATSLVAEEPLEQARLGSSLDVDEGVVVAGAPGDTAEGNDAGAAIVYLQSGTELAEMAKLTASDASSGDRFGERVAISSGVIIVGARGVNGDETDSGAAYVYELEDDEWVEQQVLVAVDPGLRDEFGGHVAIEDDVIAIAADRKDDNAADSGAVYVFESGSDGWVYTQTLWASDSESSDRFGGGVAIASGRIFVGASQEDDVAANSGAVYVFEHDGLWEETAKLKADDASAQARLGRSLDAEGDVLVVGAQVDGGAAPGAGAAYVFRHDGEEWQQEAKLVASDAQELDSFGSWVSVNGDFIVVGAFGRDVTGLNSGAAYVFRNEEDEWIELDRVSNVSGASDDRLGTAVTITERVVICGAAAQGVDDLANVGALHTFRHFDCNDNGVPDDCDIDDGSSDDCNGNEVPDECEAIVASFEILEITATVSDDDPLTVMFTTTIVGEGADEYSWDFGDGQLSEAESPEHSYAVGGEYDVTVTISDGCGTASLSVRIELDEPASEFLRGDADANGVVSGLTDTFVILDWYFVSGDAPICVDSADVDDNGEINALVDGLYLFVWAFLGGEEPLDPGIEECGADPTEDELPCAEPTSGCD